MSEADAQAQLVSLTNVSRETMEKLETYAALLEKWNPTINLVSKTTLDEKWQRHFLDSAQIWLHVPETTTSWVDIGSGAGFPGLVLAIIAHEKRPDLNITLVESDARKCAFLRNTARAVGVNVQILTQRIETIENQKFDVVSARALASISQLLTFCDKILASNGNCLFLKGQGCDRELEEAQQSHSFTAETFQSVTQQEARIVKITGIAQK
ncbi:16S rRNA (guanine(527)-N(7))-methyltransferase RsmG [Amylibacter kogurei]|uniref:Ribosomal RNA small subunit methyltransferase G n=1 Tax=Paramylibacter kogurei TaxID=1889778 RepID=A0A2G5KAL8_9RHOB|nr:16S rRNA (guanine(527)-N(7))-methyltransferase RsmG [Amylibacter kogurei]PIB26571.1 16S rRNA (guanine(527)-N(7))-methyltransferase RsmG [Amylibacter kogurei]